MPSSRTVTYGTDCAVCFTSTTLALVAPVTHTSNLPSTGGVATPFTNNTGLSKCAVSPSGAKRCALEYSTSPSGWGGGVDFH